MPLKLTAREELLVELFRKLQAEQRNEVITRLRALKDANHYSEVKLKSLNGKPLNIVGNARIEEKFGKQPAFVRAADGTNKPQPRRPDRNQDDSAPEV